MSSHETPGTAGTEPHGESAPGSVPERREVTVRRAPKYVPFLGLGGVVGVVAAAFIAYGLPGDESYDSGAVFGFFMVLCAPAASFWVPCGPGPGPDQRPALRACRRRVRPTPPDATARTAPEPRLSLQVTNRTPEKS